MDKRCEGCATLKDCPTIYEYGSVMCLMKRMQSGQTKGELENTRNSHCPHCGMPLN